MIKHQPHHAIAPGGGGRVCGYVAGRCLVEAGRLID